MPGRAVLLADAAPGVGLGHLARSTGLAQALAEAGIETERRDAFSRSKVAAGYALAEAYPLNESLRAEYEAAKARGGAP